MKRYAWAVAGIALLAFFAASCGAPIGLKASKAAAAAGGASTVTIKLKVPDYAAIAASLAASASGSKSLAGAAPAGRFGAARIASAKTASLNAAKAVGSRVVDPASGFFNLYLVPDGFDPGTMPNANYWIGEAILALTPSGQGGDPMSAMASATFTVNSGTYAMAYFQILDASQVLLTTGQLVKDQGWDGVIASGNASLAMTGFPADVTTLTPGKQPLAAGPNYGYQTKYYSFEPEAGMTYNFVLNSDTGSYSDILVLYGADGKKYGATAADYCITDSYAPFGTEVGGLGFLNARYSSASGSPYLAVYNNAVTESYYGVVPVPQYQPAETLITGTYNRADDVLNWGDWISFAVEAGKTYKVTRTSDGSDTWFEFCTSPELFEVVSIGYPYITIPAGKSVLYVNIWDSLGCNYGVSVEPATYVDLGVTVE
jgi:hypothetical protein